MTSSSGTPVLAPVPGQEPGTGANTAAFLSPAARAARLAAARRLAATGTAVKRARDGWIAGERTIELRAPCGPGDPGEYRFETIPASEDRPDAYGAWLDHVWPAAACSRPIRLSGTIAHVDKATGVLLATTSTGELPDGVIYKPCGNRRVSACPGCAGTYRRDAYQLIRAGLAGGKGVAEDISGNPAVFATFTAPSFGAVHSRPVRVHKCRDRSRCRCKAEPCHARRDAAVCRHGVKLACYRRHGPSDPCIGQPLCPDCYDYDAHAVWNHAAGELWRRTKQDIERHLNQFAARRGYFPRKQGVPVIRVAHGKVAEYQARGAVHFHAVLRLDGTDPEDPDRVLPPPPGFTTDDLQDAVRATAAHLSWRTAPHPDSPDGFGWLIAWGEQTDVRPITARGTVTDQAVASYLAKYSTKGTEASGHVSARIKDATIDSYAKPDGTHPERLIHACWAIGTATGYRGLRRWAHMLGFGGHFLTKARRYSVTLGALRQARLTYRRQQDTGPGYHDPQRQDALDAETTVVITSLSYAGTGWHTAGDALLANTAADQARKHRETAREVLAAEYADTAGLQTAA